MDLQQAAILLPCQSLEDFPLQRTAADAEQILSAWSALWHPVVLKNIPAMPSWLPAETPPEEPTGHLILVPDCSLSLLPSDWWARAEAAGASLVRGWRDRNDLVAALLRHFDEPGVGLDGELLADFLALGFCHFQVELLTRQLRYMSNLDEETFLSEVLAATEAILCGDLDTTRGRLQSAFELLHESREYFYPVQAHLLDLTLVAPSTLGKSLRTKLADQIPTNLLVCGEVVGRMAENEPETRAALVDALQNNTAAIIGGEFIEAPLPLLPPEAILFHLQRGMAAYEELLHRRPRAFGRRRFGLTPVLPQILHRLGFVGAIHCTLDDGRFPTGNQSRIQWQGIDETALGAIARVPLDIARADAFLRLPERLGDAMDLDHVATVVLAHWPGHSSEWYEDLKRIAAYSPVLGSFSIIDDYFEETLMAGQQTQYRADQYHSPYLRQEVAAGRGDPISRWVRYYARRAVAETSQALDTLATLAAQAAAGRADLLAEVEDMLAEEPGAGADDLLDEQLKTDLDATLQRCCESLVGAAGSEELGCLVANGCSFSRRMYVETTGLPAPPAVAGPVRAVDVGCVIVDVPAMGFAWIGAGPATANPAEAEKTKTRPRRKKPKAEPPLAEKRDEQTALRNEFFEVVFDPHTGAIRSIWDYYTRGPRLAQQIALRTPQGRGVEPGDDANYSIMAADELAVTCSNSLLGEIVCRGRLVDRQARRLAGFKQTTRVRRGSRIIELLIELDPDGPPQANPWQSYYACRFAWGDATADLYRSVNMANLPTDCIQVEAPHFVDIRSGKARTTLITAGLPYHRRFGLRKLDTLLAVRGETARKFRLGIGIDAPNPMSAALGFLAPQTVVSGVPRPPAISGWLFHLDARNVVATHWEPLLCEREAESSPPSHDDESPSPRRHDESPSPRRHDESFSRRRHDESFSRRRHDESFSRRRHDGVCGFRVRLLETDGRKVDLGLRSFRPIESAHKLQAAETPPLGLKTKDDLISVELGPYEWAEVEARFAAKRGAPD